MALELPAPLAPWADDLRSLPDDIALALGPLVARLAAAIGPLSMGSRDAPHAHEGFGGIARRGTYERLLVSEWLLAEEAPDEFVRRAAMAEHMFLEPERRSPAGETTSFALFDAGPLQLGAPRLAHVALLIVLSRRAEAARARFQWGVIQWQGAPLHGHVDEATVRELLLARTTRSAAPVMLERWRARITQLAAPHRTETWIVGGERTARAGSLPHARPIRVEDCIETGMRSLRVTIEGGGRVPRSVDLPLPQGSLVARMLRDPYAASAAPRTVTQATITTTAGLLVARGGRKAFMRSGRGVSVFSVPNSARAGSSAPKQIHPRGLVAAASVSMGKLLLLTSDSTTRLLTLRSGGAQKHVGHSTTEKKVHAPWMPVATDPLTPLYVRRAAQDPSVLYLDSRRWLFAFEAGESGSRLVARDALAVTSLHAGVAYIARELLHRRPVQSGHAFLTVLSFDGTRTDTDLGHDVAEAILGAGSTGPISAVCSQDGDWSVRSIGTLETFGRDRLEGHTPIAVVQPPGALPGLLALTPDRCSIAFWSKSSSDKVRVSRKPLIHAAVDDYGRTLVLVDEAHRIVFYSLMRKEVVAEIDAFLTPG